MREIRTLYRDLLAPRCAERLGDERLRAYAEAAATGCIQ